MKFSGLIAVTLSAGAFSGCALTPLGISVPSESEPGHIIDWSTTASIPPEGRTYGDFEIATTPTLVPSCIFVEVNGGGTQLLCVGATLTSPSGQRFSLRYVKPASFNPMTVGGGSEVQIEWTDAHI